MFCPERYTDPAAAGIQGERYGDKLFNAVGASELRLLLPCGYRWRTGAVTVGMANDPCRSGVRRASSRIEFFLGFALLIGWSVQSDPSGYSVMRTSWAPPPSRLRKGTAPLPGTRSVSARYPPACSV